ncbi:MAG: hypothetical protein K0R30_792 [Ornithinibacter sp.]|nr:hypothetical protein [Ornithinibacter sp.]
MAWAAVDRLAHELVSSGMCSSVEQARGKGLTDLVTGNATVDVDVVLTVPATVTPAEASTVSAPVVDDAGDALRAVPSATVDGLAVDAPRGSAPSRTSTPRRPLRGDDLVEVQGARPSEPLLVPRGWLRDHLATSSLRSTSGAGERPHQTVAACDPLSGARLDAANDLATTSYRPSASLVALVRARDGRCRFPGCAVAARFCDLDHARRWPAGSTQAVNLMCLCRRHHRVKQSPGWSVRLARDGTATWTDPGGRRRTTSALDALDALVLGPEAGRSGALHTGDTTDGRDAAETVDTAPAPPWSALETHVELLLEHRPPHRRCTTASDLRAVRARHRVLGVAHGPPPF